MAAPPLEALYHVDAAGRNRLYLYHRPPEGTPLRGAIVHVHPWAEEMNKSRRMAALTSRALAEHGWAVLQHDLLGCGDSAGDFGDARWETWVQDVIDAARWLARRHPGAPLWLWGHRAGALLATAARERLDAPADLLLWQPVQQGKALLHQFLRLKAAAQLADGGGKAVIDGVRRALAAGQSVDIAGYTLAPEMAQALEAARLEPASAHPGQVVWLEVATDPAGGPSPATAAAVPRWLAAGWAVDARTVAGPAFWQTTEIEDAPALVDATVGALGTMATTQPVPVS